MKKIAVGILAFAVWGALVLCFSLLWGGSGADMTLSRSYTPDKASVETVKQIDNPLFFRLFISDKLASYDPESYNYAAYVTAMLSGYQKLSPDKIRLEVVRVKAWSSEAKKADKAGIYAVPYNDGYIYFGLQISDDNQSYSIPRLISGRRPYFENDINRILRRFIEKEKTTVGIVSPEIPLFEATEKHKIWSLAEELSADYKLVGVSEKAPYIPGEIKVLLVLNPNRLPPLFVYALDQYLMRGGKLVIFVDPYSEAAHFYRGYPPLGKSDVTPLLKEWGIVYDENLVVGSPSRALKVAGGFRYPLWFFTTGRNNETLHFRSSGSLGIDAKDRLKYEVLAVSPQDAGTVKASSLRYASKKKAAERFKGQNQTYNLAVKVSGDFVSHYSEGYFDGSEHEKDIPPFVFVSQPGASLTVIADSDFFSDDSWALSGDEKNPFYGAEPYADNAEFVLKLVGELAAENSSVPFAAAYPKHVDTSTVAEQIAAPVAAEAERERNELDDKNKELRRQIEELNELLFDADTGSALQYRRQIADLEKRLGENNARLDDLELMLNYRTQAAVNKQLWLNIIIYPTMLILLIAGLCFRRRLNNLKKSK